MFSTIKNIIKLCFLSRICLSNKQLCKIKIKFNMIVNFLSKLATFDESVMLLTIIPIVKNAYFRCDKYSSVPFSTNKKKSKNNLFKIPIF